MSEIKNYYSLSLHTTFISNSSNYWKTMCQYMIIHNATYKNYCSLCLLQFKFTTSNFWGR